MLNSIIQSVFHYKMRIKMCHAYGNAAGSQRMSKEKYLSSVHFSLAFFSKRRFLYCASPSN